MNDLISDSGDGLDQFFTVIDAVRDDLRDLDSLHSQLQSAHETSKTLHAANAVKLLRSRMDAHVAAALKKAKLIKLRLESLDQSNTASRAFPGRGPGSSSDRTRTSVVNALRKNLHDAMNRFHNLRQQIGEEYRETVQRRYMTVTGERAGEQVLNRLIETGESETFLQKVMEEEQGKGRMMETVREIQERHEATKEVERNLMELHQVFLDMAAVVERQGEELDDIERQLNRAQSYVQGGTQQLEMAQQHQRSWRKWVCVGIVALVVVVLIIVLSVLRPWEQQQKQTSWDLGKLVFVGVF